jgi:hypothetical protein
MSEISGCLPKFINNVEAIRNQHLSYCVIRKTHIRVVIAKDEALLPVPATALTVYLRTSSLAGFERIRRLFATRQLVISVFLS